MRIVFLSALIASVTLVVSSQTTSQDDLVAQWVLEATSQDKKPTKNKLFLNPTVGLMATTPKPKQTTAKLNLTPITDDESMSCTTRDNEMGICVPYYLCTEDSQTVIFDGAGILDQRSSTCDHYLQVCCKINELQSKEAAIEKQSEKQPDATDFQSSANRNKDQESYPDPANTATVKPKNNDSKKWKKIPCGMRNPGAINRYRFRDSTAEKNSPESLFGDFPWMVAILKKSGTSVVWSQTDYVGGGTLIHPSVVMTVAHKLAPMGEPFEPSQLKCRAGEWDTQTELELYPHQERDVQRFIVHEDYYRTSLYNDIALLIMAQPFQLDGAPHMGTACLAPTPPPPGRLCYSMGWGRIDPKDRKKYASVLKKVLLHPIERNVCQDMLRRNSRLGPFFEVHQSLTCASGDADVDTCRGDGGSSLVCAVSDNPSELRFAVHGMVAYGTKCFDPNVPGMYADTAHLKTWVDDKMREEGFGSEYFTL